MNICIFVTFLEIKEGDLLKCALYKHNNIMMTSSNGNIFRVTGHLRGEFTGPWWIPHTKASDAELWCFFDLRLNKRLSKQSWGWWFETLSRSLWRHRNDTKFNTVKIRPVNDLALQGIIPSKHIILA